jgi:effector-binding domain-containing protein
MKAQPAPAELHALLREKQAELLQRIREDQARLARIDEHLGGNRGEGEPAAYSVSLGSVPALLIASIRTRIPLGALHDLHCELRAYLDRQRVVATRPGLTLFYPDDSGEGWQDVEAAIPLERPLPPTRRVGVRTLPAAERMAWVRHRGSYQTMYRAYEALGHWVEANGYRSLSPWRELYLRDGRTAVSPDAYVTEISIPIQPWKE